MMNCERVFKGTQFCQFVLPVQSVGMSTMSTMSMGVVGTFPRNTHNAVHYNVIVYIAVWFYRDQNLVTKCRNLRYWVFWTQPCRGNVFDILRNQAFSLRQRAFSGKILRRGESPQLDNFGLQFGQGSIHPEWTR